MIPLGNWQSGIRKTARTYTAFTTSQSTICAATTGGGTVYFGPDAKWYANSNPRDFTPAPTGYYRSMSAWTYDWMYLENGEMLNWGEYGSCGPELYNLEMTPASVSIVQGNTRQMTVTAYWSDSTQTNVTNGASYFSGSFPIASINTTGLVTGNSPGSTYVFATYSGLQTSQRPVTVTSPAPVITSISISPASISLPQGGTQQLTVTANWSDSSTTNVTSSTTFSSNNNNATVNSNGLVTAVNVGSSTITANYQGWTATRAVSVSAATVESITVSPTSVSLPMGRTQQLTVTAHLSNGGTQTVTSSASYSSNQTGRATVSGGGLITAGNTTGAATITITYSGRSTTMTSTTTAAVVDSLSVSPTSFSVEVGSTQQLTVTAAMSNSTNQNVTSSATYTRTNSNITVSSGGLVTGSSAGSSGVNISYGGKNTATSITVTQAVPTIVELQVVELASSLPLIEINLSSNTSEVSFFVRARYSDNSTRDLPAGEYQVTADPDSYIKLDTTNPTPRVYFEGWNIPPNNHSINITITYLGSDPSSVGPKPFTVRYSSF